MPLTLSRRSMKSLLLAACAGSMVLAPLAAAKPAPARHATGAKAKEASASKPVWAFEKSDVPLDPAWRFGRLPSGMRYIIRPNTTPKGEVMVRMEVAAGSLDESDAERGYAHYVEHMAFQGSTHVPSGEMIRLLERLGLAFGADTNAQTSFDHTTYQLDLPRNDPQLIDTALMLMRETASELTFPAAQTTRERGVVLAEKRDRNSWSYRALENRLNFIAPGARYVARMPIGVTPTLDAATPDTLRAFWARNYVPAKTTIIVIGDIDPAAVEAAIKAHFATWKAKPSPAAAKAGPIDLANKGHASIYLDPASPERIDITAEGPWLKEPDTQAQRDLDTLRSIGYGIIQRRLQRQATQAHPPFRGASFGTSDMLKAGRNTYLSVETDVGGWHKGLIAATATLRRALDRGFTQAEVAEHIANLKTNAEHAAAAQDTRSNGVLLNNAFGLLREEAVPSTPAATLARIQKLIPHITPQSVLAALKTETVPLTEPLIRFEGPKAPEGGEAALRAAWDEGVKAALPEEAQQAEVPFAYTDFGPAGTVAEDHREPDRGIREIRFANGVRLNIKHTDLAKDQVMVAMSLDGGTMLNSKADPLAVIMTQVLGNGGLGKHSREDLRSMLAGHSYSLGLTNGGDTFISSAGVLPADLDLQMELMAALLTDPGYRPEGEEPFRQSIDTMFAQSRSTPGAALVSQLGGILSDGDPRFTRQPIEAYRAQNFARLKATISDRLAHGAIEIGIVGDVNEDKAIASVAHTLGALPVREAGFQPYAERRTRPFTANHTLRIVRHAGAKDQSLVYLVWLTRDDSDPQEKQVLNMLERVVRIQLTETLRQKLGKAYSPGSSSENSRIYKGFGLFTINASVDVKDLGATRAAIRETLEALRDHGVSQDVFQRARAPLAESFDNALKSNAGWMGMTMRAQSEPDHIERNLHAKERLMAVTPAQVQAAAQRYLTDAAAVESVVLPDAVDLPRP
ncbi:M16 family metallopeptidase [Novosphingobium rosa]|uniref:M16 family metallopeptidase n=1 Tax=Novosphingobium rosa TaxID=76978 RepID=UPI001FE05389|nr:M16 family metallopeptidase [Novosphingobium rosa]